MSNNTIRIAIGLRVRPVVCQPHACVFYGMDVGELGYIMACLACQTKGMLYAIILSIKSFIIPWLQQKCLLARGHLDCMVLMKTARTGSL